MKPYHKINAYSHKLSFQQVGTFVLFIGHFSMHCVFVIRPLMKIDHPILFFIWSLHFLSLILVAYDYFVLTCSDPVDNLILEPERVKQMQTKFELYEQKIQQGKMKTNPFQLKFCQQCLRTVRNSSYHCWTCGRCV